MASVQTEASFLASWLAEATLRKESAVRIMAYLQPAMLEYEQFGDAYAYLSQRFAAGQTLDDLEVQSKLREILGDDWYVAIWTESQKDGDPARVYAAKVLRHYRARKQIRLLEDTVEETRRLLDEGKEEAVAKVADRLVGQVLTIHTNVGDQSRPTTRDEITAATLKRLHDRAGDAGIRMPFQKLASEIGNLIPGDMVGVVGYSNGGKSLFLANLWRQFAVMGVPTISFPTEGGLAWYRRGVAAHARIPQIIAEREQWSRASQHDLEAYELAIKDLGNCPWEIVDQASISPQQMIARASVIRKRWKGRTVVVIADHLHRFDYGHLDPDEGVGPATKMIRDWAREDDEGGIIVVAAYQPRKPAEEIMLYRPPMPHQVRGTSVVWNELDVYLAPYRRWVANHPSETTKWGTPAAKMENGRPVFVTPGKDDGHLDDERCYIKIGKRRTGGEGPTVALPIDGPTGHIRDFAVDGGRDALVAAVR